MITDADHRRLGLRYAIEFEADEAFDEWFTTRWFAQNRDGIYLSKILPEEKEMEPNTVLIDHDDWSMTTYDLRWSQVQEMLDLAEQLSRPPKAGSGRYPSRVLIALTSRQIRERFNRKGW
jgi:hypothetical protein